MSGRGHSLEQYANRRYFLAGGALLTDFNPYFMAVDQFEQECADHGLRFLNKWTRVVNRGLKFPFSQHP